MYKVFKLTDINTEDYVNKFFDGDREEAEEALEYAGAYSNYEGATEELPDISDEVKGFNKLVGFDEVSDEDVYVTRIVYWCEDLEDVLKALETMSSHYVGGIDEPIKFDHNGKEYVYDTDEWEGNAMVLPVDLKEAIKEHGIKEFGEKFTEEVDDNGLSKVYHYTLKEEE